METEYGKVEMDQCQYCGEMVDFVVDSDESDHEMECSGQSLWWMKGICAGATSLAEVVSRFDMALASLREKQEQGWELLEPEDNGHLHLAKKVDAPV